ncbi:farnesyl-diphosphate synthase [Cantharellus anzutake]|uniref:farnesyl-diphosphate synthase n=1 Tax=Cantharellus anzutake TaxID=1750568 RepID=UPI0019076678|nr:farnesyl-diphosphate synthase [Cantharellus anzutake]KAF8339695.1 farnesyl-diphosphate synthase [Cantharellus anzutake]
MYNLPGGKLNRGISVVDTVEILRESKLEGEEYKRVAILGWGVELLQAYFLVADDIMDASITRRGQSCWYRVEGVGNIAINDSFMLEGAVYQLLKKHFRKEPYYVDLIELFFDTTYKTEMGQLIDLITAPEHDVNLDRFSLKRHSQTVIYKTAWYSFYLPVALAMRYHGITSEDQYKLAENILIPLGEYFQIQDDYLDCFAPPEKLGKIGTDILDNKNSWVINIALQSVAPEQRKILDDNYGRKDSECEKRVKEVFRAVDVEGKYRAYEQQAYQKIVGLVNEIQEERGGLKRDVFLAFLKKIFGRTM